MKHVSRRNLTKFVSVSLTLLILGSLRNQFSVSNATPISDSILEGDIFFKVNPDETILVSITGSYEQIAIPSETPPFLSNYTLYSISKSTGENQVEVTDIFMGKINPAYTFLLSTLDLDVDFSYENYTGSSLLLVNLPGFITLNGPLEIFFNDITMQSTLNLSLSITIWYTFFPKDQILEFNDTFPTLQSQLGSQIYELSDGNLSIRDLTFFIRELGSFSTTIDLTCSIEGSFEEGLNALLISLIEPSSLITEISYTPRKLTTSEFSTLDGVEIKSAYGTLTFDKEELVTDGNFTMLYEGEFDNYTNSLKKMILKNYLEYSGIKPENAEWINSLLNQTELSIKELEYSIEYTFDGERHCTYYIIDGLIMKPLSTQRFFSLLDEAINNPDLGFNLIFRGVSEQNVRIYFYRIQEEWSDMGVAYEFPTGIKEIVYENRIEAFLRANFPKIGFVLRENLTYEIVDVNKEDNSFTVKSTNNYDLQEVYGLDIISILAIFENNVTERHPITLERDFSFETNRKIDMATGKVLYILPESYTPIEMYLTYRILEDPSEEYGFLLGGYADIGYVPFSWKNIYQPESYSPTDTIILKTPAGEFFCYNISSDNGVHFYDIISDLCIHSRYEYYDKYGYLTDVTTLSNITSGRSWDKVDVVLSLSDSRLNVGEEPEIIITGSYSYDSAPFDGKITLSSPNTLEVGDHTYAIESVSDPLYNITEYECNEVTCIWDKVDVELSLSDSHVNVGEDPEVVIKSTYAYDSEPFYGEVVLNSPSVTEVGNHTFFVLSVSDPLYDITLFQSNEVTCIWDRIEIIEGGVSSDSSKVKDLETVWFKAYYEYDNDVFDDTKGTLYINGEATIWSQEAKRWELSYTSNRPDSITFTVTSVKDDKYGLTSLKDSAGSQTIEWKSRGIPGFPLTSIILGLILCLYYLLNRQASLVHSQDRM